MLGVGFDSGYPAPKPAEGELQGGEGVEKAQALAAHLGVHNVNGVHAGVAQARKDLPGSTRQLPEGQADFVRAERVGARPNCRVPPRSQIPRSQRRWGVRRIQMSQYSAL